MKDYLASKDQWFGAVVKICSPDVLKVRGGLALSWRIVQVPSSLVAPFFGFNL